jgi:hypothetical protein
MKILIINSGGFLLESPDAPEVGRRYILEPADDPTNQQNKAFHALVQEYWKSGMQPKYGGDCFSVFRDKIKRDLGAGFDSYVYAEVISEKPVIKKVGKYNDIPWAIRTDPQRADMIFGKLKSWSDYTKKERRSTIDNLIEDMVAAGVDTPKFRQILDGMAQNEG